MRQIISFFEENCPIALEFAKYRLAPFSMGLTFALQTRLLVVNGLVFMGFLGKSDTKVTLNKSDPKDSQG
jgi:hypothetical protein